MFVVLKDFLVKKSKKNKKKTLQVKIKLLVKN